MRNRSSERADPSLDDSPADWYPAVGERRKLADGGQEEWDGKKWIDVPPRKPQLVVVPPRKRRRS